ncbi:MAG: UDP-N-acetylmuramoyl-tripeptide--D-alanyl-D-alanine ligase [Bacteroidales bacterium OttesenSCG-928-I14]|jgi:UDP-N-acetylmuramoyl-tripeptide--D-alanyl-D-alanine ligase|nr:UDP-N-acetylmuramoyl-tripeptide--D-alanyl-D-alanine ligase [Bacteroidales bacterium OttesenSCG-928-I14]
MKIEFLYQIFKRYPVVTTDSRTCCQNSIFFALKGNKFDGNDYIDEALACGSVYAVVDSCNLSKTKQIIKVKSSIQTLQSLANYHRQRMNAKIIAITGTNGKTTTKELIAAALASKYKIIYTQKNLNNHIGVPLTLLQLNSDHKFAVIEMGANHPGEIRTLCQIANPDYGLITNIGKAHLEGFGSFDKIIKEKAELYNFIRKKGGIIFRNLDNLILNSVSNSLPTIGYSAKYCNSFVYGRIIKFDPTLILEWNRKNKIFTHLVGNYNFENVLASVCVANYFGVENYKINFSISNYVPINNRSQNCITRKNSIIIDSYNANPASMQAALDNFCNLRNKLPKMVILGEMEELGGNTKIEHENVINKLFSKKINKVFLIGKNFKKFLFFYCELQWFLETKYFLEYLKFIPIEGYHILIKGSRTNQLEKVLPYL